ncbi:MAG: hypothetical protein U0939_16975 [Pirellulales bacterium]
MKSSWACAVWFGWIVCMIAAGADVVRAQTPDSAPPAKSASTLDEELLKDLLPAPERSSKRSTAPPPEQPAKPGTPPPDEAGEDLGDSPAARLRALVAPLEQVVQRLEKGDSSAATRQQQQAVIAQFDQLLSRRPRPKPAAAGAEGAAGDQRGAKPPSEKPDDGKEQGGGERHAGEPAEKPGEPKALETASELWGQLPAQVREQLQGALPEKFLPGYETLIEAYYRRIAERRRP